MSKSSTKKITKWKAAHPNTTRTEYARIKRLERLEKYRNSVPLSPMAIIASPSKCRHCKKTFDSSVLVKNLCVKCSIKRQSKMKNRQITPLHKEPSMLF